MKFSLEKSTIFYLLALTASVSILVILYFNTKKIQTSNNLVLAEIDSRDKRITTEYKLDFVHNFIGNNLNKEAVYVIINNDLTEFNYR